MEPRHGVLAGAAIAALAAVVFVVAPIGWFGDQLDVTGDDATRFLIRRYAASATGALAVIAIAAARNVGYERAVLLGLATWFAGQGSVAIWGLASGAVGGLAWLAAFVDPLLAAWYVLLARRAAPAPSPLPV